MRKLLSTIVLVAVAVVAMAQANPANPMEGLCFNPDKVAEFPGGKIAMNQYFSENLEYPMDALAERVEGRVMCQFIVMPDSTRTNVNIVRKVHPSIDAEMVRLVENMPQWTPAMKDGVPVKTLVTLPLMFKLPEGLEIVKENIIIFYDDKRYISSIRKNEKDSSYDVKIEYEELLVDSIQMYITENITPKYKELDTVLSCQFTLNADSTINNIKLYPIHSIKNILTNKYGYVDIGIKNILINDGNVEITEFDRITNLTTTSTMVLSQNYQDIQYNPIYRYISTDKEKIDEFILSEEIRKAIELDLKNLPKELFSQFIGKAQIYQEGNKIIKPQITYHINLLCKDIENVLSAPLSEKNQFILAMKPSYHGEEKNLGKFITKKCNNTAWFAKEGIAKIKFVVHKDGRLSSFEILDGSNKEVTQNIISIIKETEQQWTPGIYKNQYVDCEYVYAISLLKTNQIHHIVQNQKPNIVKIEDISYELKKHTRTAVAKGINYKKSEVVIPAYITHDNIKYKVVRVEGFGLNKKIKNVVISEGISEIGLFAFHKCTSLESITIPNSITLIAAGAFMECKSLDTIFLPDSIKIFFGAFKGCSSLKSIAIPAKTFFNYSGYGGIFEDCTSLENVVFSDSVETIPTKMFTGCKSLKAITIPKNIISIEESAFENCTSLENIVLSDNMKVILPRVFAGCKSIKTITIPKNITNINRSAFENCFSLETINIHDSIKFIGIDAFANTAWYNNQPDGLIYLNNNLLGYKGNKSKVTHIEIKGGTKILPYEVFADFKNLVSVSIPQSVTTIEALAFKNCTSLEKIDIHGSIENISGSAFTNTAWYNNQPDGLVYFDNILLAYKGDKSKITHIEIKEGTKYLPFKILANFENLVSVSIPESVTFISYGAFENCISLSEIIIPENTKTIGQAAFRGCTSLKTIEFKSTTPPEIHGKTFKKDVQIIVPIGSEEAYQELLNVNAGTGTEIDIIL